MSYIEHSASMLAPKVTNLWPPMREPAPSARTPLAGPDLADALHDCLIQFLNEVAKDKDGPALQGVNAILCPLTESLCELFQHDALLVIWEENGQVLGAQTFTPGVRAASYGEVAAQAELDRIKTLPASELGSSAFRVTQYGRAVETLCLTGADGPAAAQLWIVYQTAAPSSAWRWLVANCLAFCLAKFPQVHRRFSDSMERLAKENLLHELVSSEELSAALNDW